MIAKMIIELEIEDEDYPKCKDEVQKMLNEFEEIAAKAGYSIYDQDVVYVA